MRVIAAGCFVMAALFAAVALLGAFGLFEMAPPAVVGVSIGLFMMMLCGLALWLFNPRGSVAFGSTSPEQHLQELELAGMTEASEFRATRAFGVDEFEDEGLHYYIELEDGRVLFLSGQYLYDFEPITDDPEVARERRFPCTRFRVLRHKTEGYALDIRCAGDVIEPELMAPPFGARVWREGGVPRDGEIITGISYDTLKRIRSGGSAAG